MQCTSRPWLPLCEINTAPSIDSQCSTATEDADFDRFEQPLFSSGMINEIEGRHDLVDRLAPPNTDLPEDYQEGEQWQDLASSLTELYTHYHRGVAKLDVMPTTVISATPSVFASQEPLESANAQVQLDVLSSTVPLLHPSSFVSSEPVDPADAQVQAAMSRTQHQLIIEEGKLWERLTDPDEAVDHDESPTTAILASLREKSSFMVQSYLRRNNPPTEITYEESKDILRAMGVPCVESTGPYEAEALASSLVLNGCADYVASEDTVRIESFSGALGPASLPPTHQIPAPPPLAHTHTHTLYRTFSSTGRLSSATSRTRTRRFCSSRAQKCNRPSASMRARSLTLHSCSERTSPPAYGKLVPIERCNTSASTAR
jgi:hypothetical protein